MALPFLNIVNHIRKIDRQEFIKLVSLAAIFAMAVMAYTVLKELKDIVFSGIVGIKYIPNAKLVTIFALIPLILFYSYIVNRFRRYQVLCMCMLFYGVLGLGFAYLAGTSTIGLASPHVGPERILGWIFYVFIEGASPFIIGATWAFMNSVISPTEAREEYGFLTASSKIGGMLGAGLSWLLLTHFLSISGIVKEQLLIAIPSIVLLLIPLVIIIMVKSVSGKYFHGYEAAYEYQKEADKTQKKPGLLSGLGLLFKQPYALGIFTIVLFYEMVDAVLSYLRLVYASGVTCSLEGLGSKLFAITFSYHMLGFFIALFGTTTLLHWLGERKCLTLIPLIIGALLATFLIFNTFTVFVVVFIIMRAVDYGFFYPVRESLYIPTVKAIKFQSKAWTDTFAKRIAKAFGSQFNIVAQWLLQSGGLGIFQAAHWIFFAGIVGCWAAVSIALGKKYAHAVKNNEVIGSEHETA